MKKMKILLRVGVLASGLMATLALPSALSASYPCGDMCDACYSSHDTCATIDSCDYGEPSCSYNSGGCAWCI
ncbi:MAG TPA: hypothetical protein VGM82_21145 [Gemmatimonadaceae bacterium]